MVMSKSKRGGFARRVRKTVYNKENAKTKNRDFRFRGSKNYGIKPEWAPRVLFTRGKYGTQGTLTQVTQDTSVVNTFRLNSIWAPSQSFIGTTIVGHSNLASLYGRYLVLGAKVILSWNQTGTAPGPGTRMGIRLRIGTAGTANATNVKGLVEQPNTYMDGLNTNSTGPKHQSVYVRPWTLLGVTELEYRANTSKYSSAIGASPTDQAFMDIFMVNPNQAANTIGYALKIIYYFKCYDRLNLSSTAHA